MQLLSLANQANLVAVNANDNDTDPTQGQLLPTYPKLLHCLLLAGLMAHTQSLTCREGLNRPSLCSSCPALSPPSLGAPTAGKLFLMHVHTWPFTPVCLARKTCHTKAFIRHLLKRCALQVSLRKALLRLLQSHPQAVPG